MGGAAPSNLTGRRLPKYRAGVFGAVLLALAAIGIYFWQKSAAPAAAETGALEPAAPAEATRTDVSARVARPARAEVASRFETSARSANDFRKRIRASGFVAV